MNIRTYMKKQALWSNKTFGPGPRAEGICKHIEKELAEVRAEPYSPEEWADIAILALDGMWRCHVYGPTVPYNIESAADIVERTMLLKQDENRARKWPPPGPQDSANEHIR